MMTTKAKLSKQFKAQFYAVRHRVSGWVRFDYELASYMFTLGPPSLYASAESAEAVITDLPKAEGYEVVMLEVKE